MKTEPKATKFTDDDYQHVMRYSLIMLLQIAVVTIVIAVASIKGGQALDAHFGTSPKLLIVCIILGFVLLAFLVRIPARKIISRLLKLPSNAGKEEMNGGNN